MNRLQATLCLLALGVAGPACKEDERIANLEKRVSELEGEVATLKGGVEGKASPIDKQKAKARAAAEELDPVREEEASDLLQEIHAHLKANEASEAQTAFERLKADYGDTKVYKKARKLEAEISVVGKGAPTQLGIDTWFQGQDQFKPEAGKVTLYVFWEVWCPHCRKEVPALQATYDELAPQGLQLVALTKQTRNKTEDDIRSFLAENKVKYPVAKEDGTMSTYFAVTGIPAAALVKDGKVVWRGHPGKLSIDTLKGYL